jgi:hypothetical protein
MAKSNVATRIGSNPPAERIVTGTPPIIMQAQTTGFVLLNKPEELEAWEEDLRRRIRS